jgi:hypothetical protein
MNNPLFSVSTHFSEKPEVRTDVQVTFGNPSCYVLKIGPLDLFFQKRETYLETIDAIKAITLKYYDV